MASQFVHAERSATQRYSFKVSRLGDNQRTTLSSGDIFNFFIRVYLSTTPTPTLLLYCPSQTIPCHSFLQDDEFLRTLLSRIHVFIDSMEEITKEVISCVQELFKVDGVASRTPPPSSSSSSSSLGSQHGDPENVPLWLEMNLFDTGLLAAMEESKQVPASKETIETSLKKCTEIGQSEFCPICKEELNDNIECALMPCDHVFHEQCIMSWLYINNVCPVCRNSLSTLRN